MSAAHPEVRIRAERPDDSGAIRDVVAAAFAPDEAVAPLVEKIRASSRYVAALSLVAVKDGAVVGHIMLSHADVVDESGAARQVLTLSPLAVAVSHQRTGIGGRLVAEALASADSMGEPLVVVEGHPDYYPRFGFTRAGDLEIEITLPEWAPPEAAMALGLSGHDPAIRGQLVYPPAFDDVVG